MDLFIRAVNKYNALEKIPAKTRSKHNLHHSERHLIDKIEELPGMNVTEFAVAVGMTKGAVSQFMRKLEDKGLARRYKKDNDKEVFMELTREGRDVYLQHRKKNEETVKPLLKEIRKYPDEHIEFFISMLNWINRHIDESTERIKG